MKKYMYRMANHNRKGFSLVELVVVILIIAILAAAIFLGGATVIRQSRESALRNDLRNYGTYVQDMMYATPELQYNKGKDATFADGSFNTQESYSLTTKDGVIKGATAYDADIAPAALADGNAVRESLPVLKLLNNKFLTADFVLDGFTTKDPWDNAYCYSYDMSPSSGTGDPASCIIVINSLGVNSLDETSDASVSAANDKGIAANVIDNLGKTGVEIAGESDETEDYMSATDVVNSSLVKNKTGDDYGVVIVMIDGQVSTAYYGFN